MSAATNRTFICSVVFLDIVGYSKKPVTEQIQSWVEDPQEVQRIRQQLQGVMGQPGATQRFANWIVKVVDGEIG